MHISFSRHTETVHTRASDVWPQLVQENFRPLLNIQALSELLQIATDDDTSVPLPPSDKRKKQSLHTLTRHSRPSKRARISEGSTTLRGRSETSAQSDESDDLVWPHLTYPDVVPLSSTKLPEADEVSPVFQHVFDIQYTNESIVRVTASVDDDELYSGWSLEDQNLLGILTSLQFHLTEPRTIDIGDADLIRYRDRLIVASPLLENRTSWCLLLPPSDQEIDLTRHDISSKLVQDIMMACYILRSVGRTTIQARFKIIILPPGTYDIAQHELPFRLLVEVTVSLRIPSIFEPFPRGEKKKTPEIEDAQRRMLEFLYPSSVAIPESFDGVINVPLFYSILRPAPPLPVSIQDKIQPPGLLPTLLPFQRRSVNWMLDREGKTVTPNGEIVSKPASSEFTPWEKITEGNSTWYLNRLSGILSPSLPSVPPVLGGILAEEPGLGKTLETIALILMNPAPPERNPSLTRWDPEARLEVKAIKSTLIVTPPALASQWADEFATHAPSLSVLMYDGWSKVKVPITTSQVRAARRKVKKSNGKTLKKAKTNSKVRAKDRRKGKRRDEDTDSDTDITDADDDDDTEIQDWCSYVNTFDVVIVTYAVLRTDFNVALAAPIRPRREDVVYSNVERPRSPLVMVEWNRVVMDEVQMVGGGKTEDMVSLIPRLSSFAVSGTPARAQVADLIHILKFLRVDHIIGSPRLWNRMITSRFGAAYFAALFQSYTVRTLKSNVKDELTIPQQTRYLVSITLGPVERHVYDQVLEAALLDLGLDTRGIATSQGWQVDGALLRTSLRRLRGICTHPQVGQLQRPGDKLYKSGAVKTIDDVLQNMRESNWRTMMDDSKSKVQTLIRIAQLQNLDELDGSRFQSALEALLEAEREALALINEVEAVLEKHLAKGRLLKMEMSAIVEGEQIKEKGKQREVSAAPSDPDDSGDENSSYSPAGEEHGKKRGALQNRLRECRLALHRAKFLQGDIYHALGTAHSASEDAAYEAAEKIRCDLLKGTEEDAMRAMALLEHDAAKKELTLDALLTNVPFLDDSPIRALAKQYKPTKAELALKPLPHKVGLYNRVTESHELITETNDIITYVLNEQSALMWEWRSHITALLTQKLSSGEDQADGEAETYLQSYAALLSDRRQALLNERTLLAAHDVREKKLRHTKAAMNATNVAREALLRTSDEIELQPEHEVLHATLSQKRKEILQDLNGRAIKSVLIDLNAAATRITKNDDPEKLALKDAVAELRQFIAEQGSLMDKLDADLTHIRKAFNQRVLYFRQLQEISDSVAEVTWEATIVDAILESSLEKNELDAKINRTRARQRYLENLTKIEVRDEHDEDCILCRCEFIRGFITQCAHIFCEGCMKAWLLRREGKTCPVCRVAINPDTIERFTVNEPEPEKPPQRAVNGEAVPKSRRQISYNMIDPQLFSEIQSMESFGDFGSKIQTLIRHLLYLKFTDPGAKSIVFSAWADSLHIMERALRDNKIRYLKIDQKSKGENAAKRFKSDPDILVLLLHGERENAGLNITCASRVFLLESVVHHGFEVQAIARIDRMGQTRPTEVYCYYAEDTVERNILDLAARQGLSLYTKDNSAGTLNMSSLATDVEKKAIDSPRKKVQKGDFIFKMDDMLAILFPHMYEDIEYLLPSEDTIMQDATELASLEYGLTAESSSKTSLYATAGPSRTR